MPRLFPVLGVLLVLVAACGDDSPTHRTDPCNAVELPLSAAPDGPVITDAGLEVGPSVIAAVATATDPQGIDDFLNVLQTFRVFTAADCGGTAIVLQDDLAGSGVEETFGTVADMSVDPQLYQAIAGADRWPVELEFMDADGHVTSGRVLARVIH